MGTEVVKIKDLPLEERPREKAKLFGVESLGSAELLALIIGSGSVNKSAIEVGLEILQVSQGVYNLPLLVTDDLLSINGLSDVKILRLLAAFELFKRCDLSLEKKDMTFKTPTDIYRKYYKEYGRSDQESFLIGVLDRQSNLLKEKVLYHGNENNFKVSIRLFLKAMLVNKAAKFFLVHNHPSGIKEPSMEDIALTNMIQEEAYKIGLQIYDHVIIVEQGYFSFLENNLIHAPLARNKFSLRGNIQLAAT